MPKIHSLSISNFRGIKSFYQNFGQTDFICIIGRGDSGKTTVLEAISLVLCSHWNISIYDTDFYNCEIDNPINIEVTLYDLPLKLVNEDKYGLLIRGISSDWKNINDEIHDEDTPCLTLRLIVEKDLEPRWYIINNREGKKEIRSSDRSKINSFFLTDHIDRNFSWNKGNPLYSLLQLEELSDNNTIITEAFRKAKDQIDLYKFPNLQSTLEKVKLSAKNFGIDIDNTSTSIDLKDIVLKDSKICLHDENKIPFRLKGKGSKRLLSLAIQFELVKAGGILLIDEIEQGLEPDRAQHIAQTLLKQNKGQIFITTHSRDVLVELGTENMFHMKKYNNKLLRLESDLKNTLRNSPEAFFANKVIICEGATEVGICRALNSYRISKALSSLSLKGVRLVDGGGSTFIDHCTNFVKAGFTTCIFCDSDVININLKKEELRHLKTEIVDCDNSNSLEMQVFHDMPWTGVLELVEYAIYTKGESSIISSLSVNLGYKINNLTELSDSEMVRKAICKSSVSKSYEWFKRIDHGEVLGNICLKHLDLIKEKTLGKQLIKLNNWIGND